ncbi:Short-chain dehydrogenase [Nonomuraea solani]|uniref:Short-chain dehydrogenase n=1 Tax=Nonomuraea solani TaxID=1144553 RepID=A0A1H6ECN9_9ACTN|nr:Short-chain dehydrogenase [Nonomuraea solani]
MVITGAAGGIGTALARRFAAEGAAALVLADVIMEPIDALAGELPCRVVPIRTDVSCEKDVREMTAAAERLGGIDLLCSNAGTSTALDLYAPDRMWAGCWETNVMGHVYAARAALPAMVERGSGYLLHTCSAAGLLTLPMDAPYSVTKHAAVALAEWLSIAYGDAGIKVSVLCPSGVRTGMTTASAEVERMLRAFGPLLEPEQVADAVVGGLAGERFLILPDPDVSVAERRRAADRDQWLADMRLVAGRGARR